MSASDLHAFFPPDSGAGKRRRVAEMWFQGLLLALVVLAAWMLRLHGLFQPLAIDSPAALVQLLAAVAVSMLLHEGGHLVAALLLRFEFLGASLGPFRLQFLHGKRKVTFWPRRLFSASVSAAPRRLKHWRACMMLVVAAGPLATLLTAGGALYGLRVDVFRVPQMETFLQFALQMNVLLFVVGLIPNRASARQRNDARLLLMLAGRGAEMELSVLLTLLVIQGARPQDYPKELMLRAAQWRGRPESEYTFAQALVRWAADSGERILAEAWDARALAISEQCDGRLRNQALASSACVDILFRDDFESARQKFSVVDTDVLFPKCFEYRVRAAKQLALGRTHRASAEIIRAQYSIPKGVVAYDLERKLLEILHLRVLMPASSSDMSRGASCSI